MCSYVYVHKYMQYIPPTLKIGYLRLLHFFLHWLLFVANPELDELLAHIFSHSVGVYFSFAPFAQQEFCDLIKVSMFSSVSYALKILARKIIDCTNVSKTFLNVFILLRVPSINRG